ncbi:transcriptional regulator [Vibrio sp. UCD-FRSSP16_10]|uniref:LysR substrate-binding domain-containing protein n=1 Tax=unclassified Vibrio TaxID=2614977 RepID=UPI0007FCF78F|nr:MULTISPECIES: LysR substrate-binding domain-containing protein [unclassified Vibrio]OBT16943.1 transcriptional regulator [Vibrio sp. UCD-FRSSP16_30]OBT21934.1 transcriptional regulator [Vibrio sp. UCD-FRSSP16_10]
MKSRLPSTKNLQIFLATAEHLNFTHAAQAMNMTQGAISRQIQSLEALMGTALFYRQARGLSLTAEGNKLIPLAEDILNRLRKAVVEVTERSNRIKLNAPSCVTSWLLPRLMSFQQDYPDIEVELTSSIKHQSLPNFESFDLVIVYGRPLYSLSVTEHVLFEEKLTPVCAPQLWNQIIGERSNWHDRDLTQFTWLHANPMYSDWGLWLEKKGDVMQKGKRNQIFSTLDQAMNAALHGFGIAVGDITLADEDLKLNRLMRPYPEHVVSGQSYYLLRPKEAQSTAIDDFLRWLLPA